MVKKLFISRASSCDADQLEQFLFENELKFNDLFLVVG